MQSGGLEERDELPAMPNMKAFKTPAQDKLREEINQHKANILHYQSIPHISLIARKDLMKEKETLMIKEKKLVVLQQSTVRQKNLTVRRKTV